MPIIAIEIKAILIVFIILIIIYNNLHCEIAKNMTLTKYNKKNTQ